jgi:hypothetical protein
MPSGPTQALDGGHEKDHGRAHGPCDAIPAEQSPLLDRIAALLLANEVLEGSLTLLHASSAVFFSVFVFQCWRLLQQPFAV